jgi:hypothetical protein
MDEIVSQPQEDLLPDFPEDAPVNEAVEETADSFWGNIDDKAGE